MSRAEFVDQVEQRVCFSVSGGGDGGAGGGEQVRVCHADERQQGSEAGQLGEQDRNVRYGMPEIDRVTGAACPVKVASYDLQIDQGLGCLSVRHCWVATSFASGTWTVSAFAAADVAATVMPDSPHRSRSVVRVLMAGLPFR